MISILNPDVYYMAKMKATTLTTPHKNMRRAQPENDKSNDNKMTKYLF